MKLLIKITTALAVATVAAVAAVIRHAWRLSLQSAALAQMRDDERY
jgi:hypothetical protein